MAMGWKPESGFHTWDWKGYNEAMILYVLALGSPTHPIDSTAWTAYTSTYQWRSFYDEFHVNFAPLFGHQYSHLWIDFRGIQDEYMRARGIDYFENSRRAVRSQHAYAVANPGHWNGYSAELWGLSASDGPADGTWPVAGTPRRFFTYAARGAAGTEVRDDGTITPTAAASSIAFEPQLAITAITTMRARFGDALFGRYGFLDAFNLSFPLEVSPKMGRVVPALGWFDSDYLGIDQGPIVIMIENYRNGMIWDLMKRSLPVRRGLERAGFRGGWLGAR